MKSLQNLDHSRPLDVHIWSGYPSVNSWINRIWSDHFEARFARSGHSGRPPKTNPKSQLKVLLLDFFVAWSSDPDLLIGIAMTKSGYSLNRYNALHISSIMIELVNTLVAKGLIDKQVGSEAAGKTTRIWPTQVLIDEFLRLDVSEFDIESAWDKEVIVLNQKSFEEIESEDKNKRVKAKAIDYDDDDFEAIREMRADLRAYNALLSKTYVDVGSLEKPFVVRKSKQPNRKDTFVPINQRSKFVRRIFYRGDWTLGGRFHGGFWQQIGSEYRKDILINDQRTVEIDFSGMHISLAYGLEGHQPPKDPYDIGPMHEMLGVMQSEQRPIVKQLILCAINAEGRKQSFRAFRQSQPAKTIQKSLKDDQLQMLIEAFCEKNASVKSYIASDSGVSLMAVEARVAARVINHFVKRDLPILTIHDSYIVQFGKDEELIKAMNRATKEELKGYQINLDVETVSLGAIKQLGAMETMDRGLDYLALKKAMSSIQRCKGYKARLKKYQSWKEKKQKKKSRDG